MTPIEVLKILQSKIDEAKFYKTNYVLQTNDIEMIAEALRIHDVVGRSEQLVCDCPAHTYYEWEKEENKCTECDKPLYAN
jgi:hypothetical protein